MTVDTSVFRPATLIDQAIDNTLVALGIGLVLALIVMIALVRSWPPSLLLARLVQCDVPPQRVRYHTTCPGGAQRSCDSMALGRCRRYFRVVDCYIL
jgi:hypothetical protein